MREGARVFRESEAGIGRSWGKEESVESRYSGVRATGTLKLTRLFGRIQPLGEWKGGAFPWIVNPFFGLAWCATKGFFTRSGKRGFAKLTRS